MKREMTQKNRDVNALAEVLIAEWKRVDPNSTVSLHPASFIANFADMARAALSHIEKSQGAGNAARVLQDHIQKNGFTGPAANDAEDYVDRQLTELARFDAEDVIEIWLRGLLEEDETQSGDDDLDGGAVLDEAGNIATEVLPQPDYFLMESFYTDGTQRDTLTCDTRAERDDFMKRA